MKYVKYSLVGGVLCMILLLTSSYTTRTSGISEGINPGNMIPDFELKQDSVQGIRLSDLRGQKILISLWAAYDADSHMKNLLLWNSLQKEGFPVKMISISFDLSKSIFEKTLDMDGISKESQYIDIAGKKSEIYRKCQLAKKGFNNFLVDENGVIVATNLTPKKLERLLN